LTFQTPPRRGEPSKAPSKLTDVWIVGEMSKAHYDGLLRADKMACDVSPDDETYWSVIERSMLFRRALRNVQNLVAGLKYLVVFNSEGYMVGRVRVHENSKKNCVNMLFLYGFSRYKESGKAILKCVAKYSRSLYGDDATIMAINPLSPLYRRLFQYECSCVSIREPMINGETDDDFECEDAACFEPFEDFCPDLDDLIKNRMIRAMDAYQLTSYTTDITSCFGAILKTSVVLQGD
jgi:hypothetical protein